MRIHFIDMRSVPHDDYWYVFMDGMTEYLNNNSELVKEEVYLLWKHHLKIERFDVRTREEWK